MFKNVNANFNCFSYGLKQQTQKFNFHCSIRQYWEIFAATLIGGNQPQGMVVPAIMDKQRFQKKRKKDLAVCFSSQNQSN